MTGADLVNVDSCSPLRLMQREGEVPNHQCLASRGENGRAPPRQPPDAPSSRLSRRLLGGGPMLVYRLCRLARSQRCRCGTAPIGGSDGRWKRSPVVDQIDTSRQADGAGVRPAVTRVPPGNQCRRRCGLRCVKTQMSRHTRFHPH